MKKLALDFYGEKISIPYPKDFSSLSNEINQNFQLNLSEVFTLDISYTKNKIKKSIKSENDFKLFINSKASLINIEIVESADLIENIGKNSKGDKDKLELLKKKREQINKNIEKKEKETKIKTEEYKNQIESLSQQKAQYLIKLQNDMKNQNKNEKDLIIRITQLAQEIKAKLVFKLPEKGPLPVKGNSKKEKEYIELIKQYTQCLKQGEKLFSIPRNNIDDMDRQIKAVYRKHYGNSKSSQEEIFELKKKLIQFQNRLKIWK